MRIKKLLCLILSLLIIFGAVPFCAYALDKDTTATGTSVYYIETYEQLKAHALHAQADCRYILNNDIVQEDNLNDMEITIPAGVVFNLDLNGYNIKRITQGNDCALFRIKSDGRMTIIDTSENKTGGCSFSEGYSDYYKAVFINDGGELEIFGGYYEIFSPYEQGECSIVRITSGYTNIYDGTFDSSASWGGDTISVGHYSYFYDTPYVVIFGGDFYGKYSNIDVSPMGNYLNYGKEYPDGSLHPSVYVLGGNFYITKKSEHSGFCYCNNSWGRVIVAQGKVPYKCLNSIDQRFLDGVSKKYTTDTIDDYTEGYYEVTAPPVIMSEGIDYYYRLINLCRKADVNSYGKFVYDMHKEDFDYILSSIDTIIVSETDTDSPEIRLENRTTDHQYINWYIVDESDYNGKDTKWTHLGDIQNVSQWTPEERPEEGKNYIIRMVATNSKLETYEDLIRLSYEPLKKTEIVDSVKVSDIRTPFAGDNPDFEFSAEETFYINGIYWTDITYPENKVSLKETDTFEAGHKYELQVWIRTNEFYNFKTDSDDCIDIKAFADNKEAEVILPGTAISAELALIFTVPEESETTASTDPTEFSESTESTKATEVTEATETTNATESTALTEPANSTEPTEVTKPSDSTDPTESETASATESTAGNNNNPTVTTKPAENTKPSEGTESTPAINTKPSKPVEEKGILGDVDYNGKVNIKDATMIQKFAAKIISLTDAEKLRADVNADAKVNVKDATAIQKYAAKIETGFPIGEPVK